MKPENLGNVRVRISLQDNHIAGRIIVENNTIRQLFQENLDSLSRALAEQGYQDAQLNVYVSGEGKGGAGQRREAEHSPLWGMEKLKEAVPLVFENSLEETKVNLMV